CPGALLAHRPGTFRSLVRPIFTRCSYDILTARLSYDILTDAIRYDMVTIDLRYIILTSASPACAQRRGPQARWRRRRSLRQTSWRRQGVAISQRELARDRCLGSDLHVC